MVISLDSNVVIDVLRGREIVRRRLAEARSANASLSMSSLAFEEVMFGVHRQPSPGRAEAALRSVLTDVEITPFEPADAECASRARAQMASRGIKAPRLDFLIGAQALARGHMLATANTRDFQNIPGLQLVDWTKPPEDPQDSPHA